METEQLQAGSRDDCMEGSGNVQGDSTKYEHEVRWCFAAQRSLGETREVYRYRRYICAGTLSELTRVEDRLAVPFVSSLRVRL